MDFLDDGDDGNLIFIGSADFVTTFSISSSCAFSFNVSIILPKEGDVSSSSCGWGSDKGWG